MARKSADSAVQVLGDFLGGRNTLYDVFQINLNQHTTTGQDVWCEFQTLAKRRGATAVQIQCDYNHTADGVPALASKVNMYADRMATCRLTNRAGVTNDPGLIIAARGIGGQGLGVSRIVYTDDNTNFYFAGYSEGSVTVTQNSAVVTGSGTHFTTNCKVNDVFYCQDGVEYQILSIQSDTQLTLTANYGGTGAAGQTFLISPLFNGVSLRAHFSIFDVSGTQNLFMHDGNTSNSFMLRLDGSHMWGVGAFPLLKQNWFAPFKNYMFALYSDTQIAWSAIKDATTWPANNTQTITNAGHPLRGMVVYNDTLIVFARDQMFRIIGDAFDPLNPTYYIQQIPVPPNFIFDHPDSCVVHKGRLIFLTNDGWFSYIGGNFITKMSYIIQPDVDSFTHYDVNTLPAVGQAVVGISQKGRAWWTLPDTNQIYVLDERDAWWKWSVSGITDLVPIQFRTGTAPTLMGATNSGANKYYLLTLDTGNSDQVGGVATAINGTWESREILFPNEMEFVEVAVYMLKQSAGNLTLSVSIDRAAYVNFTCAMTAGVGTIIRKWAPIQRLGKAIRIKINNNIAAQTFGISRIEFLARPTEAVRI